MMVLIEGDNLIVAKQIEFIKNKNAVTNQNELMRYLCDCMTSTRVSNALNYMIEHGIINTKWKEYASFHYLDLCINDNWTDIISKINDDPITHIRITPITTYSSQKIHFNTSDENRKPCMICGCYLPQKALRKHHISYFPENIVNLCTSCHAAVHSRNEPIYKKYISSKKDAHDFYLIKRVKTANRDKAICPICGIKKTTILHDHNDSFLQMRKCNKCECVYNINTLTNKKEVVEED